MTDIETAYEQHEAVPAEVVQRLLSEYFENGCFSLTATAFAGESTTAATKTTTTTTTRTTTKEEEEEEDVDMDADANDKQRRVLVKAAVLEGRIADALALLSLKGSSLVGSPLLSSAPSGGGGGAPTAAHAAFLIHAQMFIELVRVGDSKKALLFAQTELAAFAALDPKYFDALSDIGALIAYSDPFASPLAHYLSQQRREEVANYLNGFLLAQQNLPATTSLERIVAQATLVRQVLSEPVTLKEKKAAASNSTANPKAATVYPKWELSSFLEQTSTA
ncbi:UNVERIFIED_CONTAM: hypothetical protein HDU68_008347 [Siphonaria sp. JEL0065]|nr:hypothetical protein HDU68_008347 [Siphonaria sp. JEL0065]